MPIASCQWYAGAGGHFDVISFQNTDVARLSAIRFSLTVLNTQPRYRFDDLKQWRPVARATKMLAL